jgi:thymidylate synthase
MEDAVSQKLVEISNLWQSGSFEKDKNREEQAYLQNLMWDILAHGERKKNRTGVDTYSTFGNVLRFSLTNSEGKRIIPLLTTKKTGYRLIVEELLWFLSGSTDSQILHNKGVKIWDANGSREALDKLGFKEREEGDLGPVYGFQWRHFGAGYKDCRTDYSNKGIDQIAWVVGEIKKNPSSRRLVVSAWNPGQLAEMALPPCHILFQFNVGFSEEKPKYLDCALYQRSADVPLGVPFNIASYATLIHMIAQQTGLQARNFVYFTADTHVYANQIPGCLEQLGRVPYPWPTLQLPDVPPQDIFSYKIEDFVVQNYKCHPEIKFPFAV